MKLVIFDLQVILLSYHTNESLRNLGESVKTQSERKHLMLNVKKIKGMKTDERIRLVSTTVNGETLETVNKYEYFGSAVTENSDGKIEIRRR